MSELVPHTYSFCRRCDSRVELGRIEYGTAVACPMCGLEFVVESPAHRRAAKGQGRGVADAESERVPLRETVGFGPLGMLFSGTFTFPLRLTVLPQTVALCFAATSLFAVVRLGMWCAASDSEEIDRATRLLLWNGLALSMLLGSLALVAWFYAASAYGMTILRETAAGADVIGEWPNLLAFDDSGQCFYVFNSIFLAVLPGALAAPLWKWLGVPLGWAIGACVVMMLPMFLLSMLAGSSPLHLVSLRLWRSLRRGILAWLGFHLTTLAAGIAVAWLEVALWRHASWTADIVVTGPVATMSWMIYCRLAGRLFRWLSLAPGG